MVWIQASFCVFLTVTLATFSQGQVDTSQEKLQELCSRYKFLWSDADPSVFYYCFTNKAAVQLKCRSGFYMCKREGQPFHPCDCQFDHNLDTDTMTDEDAGEFLANGCPDPFQRHPSSHRFGGTQNRTVTTLGECQMLCLQSEDCIGVDWVTFTKQCFILDTDAERYALSQKDGVTHYMRTTCTSAPSTASPEQVGISNGGGAKFPGSDNELFSSNSDGNGGKQGILFTTTQSRAAATASTATPATTCPTPTSSTIPDTGCPFALEKFPMMAHPFGTNITTSTANTNENDCKAWCVNRDFCRGIDWDSSLSTCYWFQEIQTTLVVSTTNVNHYRKTTCGRPLMCWQQSGSGNQDQLVAVTNTSTTQVQCQGLCFLRQTVSTTIPTIVRDCQVVTAGATAPALGCSIDTSLLTVTCYCDTDRCNGLSLAGLSSQILYLPLNGNQLDHSGYNRFAVTAQGFSTPTFSCLDRFSNCSALFTGSQCIQVAQMTQTVWGPIDASGNVTPQLSLAVSFKRLPDKSTTEEGIFGNSNSATVQPSWAIIGRTNENIVRAGIDSTTAPTGLNDFMRGMAPANVWHNAVLTYDGRDILANDLPLTRFYIDATRQSGNEQADMGEVQIRAQPVTVGCVSELTFTGFIDEVRIFNSVLQLNDVEALNIMQDSLYM